MKWAQFPARTGGSLGADPSRNKGYTGLSSQQEQGTSGEHMMTIVTRRNMEHMGRISSLKNKPHFLIYCRIIFLILKSHFCRQPFSALRTVQYIIDFPIHFSLYCFVSKEGSRCSTPVWISFITINGLRCFSGKSRFYSLNKDFLYLLTHQYDPVSYKPP